MSACTFGSKCLLIAKNLPLPQLQTPALMPSVSTHSKEQHLNKERGEVGTVKEICRERERERERERMRERERNGPKRL